MLPNLDTTTGRPQAKASAMVKGKPSHQREDYFFSRQLVLPYLLFLNPQSREGRPLQSDLMIVIA